MIDYENYIYDSYMIPATYSIKENNLLNPDETILLGNIKKDTYIPYKNYKYFKPSINSEREFDLFEIQKLCFYCHELNLLLDLEPNNQEYLNLCLKYNNELTKKEKEYHNKYNLLCVSDYNGSNKWKWVENPWPWQK